MGLCLKSLRVLSAYSDKTQRWVSMGAGLHSYVHKNHLETLNKHRSVGGGTAGVRFCRSGVSDKFHGHAGARPENRCVGGVFEELLGRVRKEKVECVQNILRDASSPFALQGNPLPRADLPPGCQEQTVCNGVLGHLPLFSGLTGRRGSYT